MGSDHRDCLKISIQYYMSPINIINLATLLGVIVEKIIILLTKMKPKCCGGNKDSTKTGNEPSKEAPKSA